MSANCTLKNVSFLLGAKAIDKDDLADSIYAHAAHIYHCAIGYWSIRISLLDHDSELQRKPRESFPLCAASFRIQFLISGARRQRDALNQRVSDSEKNLLGQGVGNFPKIRLVTSQLLH